MDKIHDVIVVGSGCAGYTASIYLSRASLNPLQFAGPLIGGQLTTTTHVENFPGFPDGILGPQLMMNMAEQAKKFGTKIIYENIIEIKKKEKHFVLFSESKEYLTKSVIIATGAKPRHLGLKNEKELIGNGLTSCATCDGAFYKNEEVCVIGGGDSACEEADFLTKFASKVYLIHRRDELRASKIMADRVLKNEKIVPIWNTEVAEYISNSDGKMEAVRLKNLQDRSEKKLPVACVFIAIGHIPSSEFVKDLVDCDENGYILQKKFTETSVPGIFSAGDVSDHRYRQAITASGQACSAALDVEKYLTEIA